MKEDEMRDRLIAALKTAKDEIIDLDLKGVADKLIAAGVILPKFRIGQKVWYSVNNPTCGGVYNSTILAIELRDGEIYYTLVDEWGGLEHEFAATEAEARAALEGKE